MKILIKAVFLIAFSFHNCDMFASAHKIELPGPFFLCEECCTATHSSCCKVGSLICPMCRDPKMQYSETLFFAKNDKSECPICLDRYIPSPEIPIAPTNSPALPVFSSALMPSAPPVSPVSAISREELAPQIDAAPVLLKPREFYRVRQQLLEEARRTKDEERRNLIAFAQNLTKKQFRHPKKDKK